MDKARTSSFEKILEKLLEEALREIAPSFLHVLDFLSKKTTGRSLVENIIYHPRDAYKVLIEAFETPELLELIDNLLIKHISKKHGIIVDKSLLLELEEGSNGTILEVLSKIKKREKKLRGEIRYG